MQDSSSKKRRVPIKTSILVCFLLTGVIIHQLGIINWFELLEISREYADYWWFPLVIIISKIVLYTFALPGSIFYWIAGALYHPHLATLIIVLGGMSGALSAYYFSQRMSDDSAQKVKTSRFFSYIRKHGDFPTLSAVRILPNFPHSVINYGSGILRISMVKFIPSTLIGFSVKGYIYSSAMYHVTTEGGTGNVISFKIVVPLIALAAFFLIVKLLQKRLDNKLPHGDRKHDDTP